MFNLDEKSTYLFNVMKCNSNNLYLKQSLLEIQRFVCKIIITWPFEFEFLGNCADQIFEFIL